MTVSGELCCVALPFCCVVVALPFSESLGVIVYVHNVHVYCKYSVFSKAWAESAKHVQLGCPY